MNFSDDSETITGRKEGLVPALLLRSYEAKSGGDKFRFPTCD